MNWTEALQSMFSLPPPDGRSDNDIARDLEDEFAFHLDQSAREFIDEGESAEQARLRARERFGDVSEIKRRCTRIALEERIMLQRINFALMIIVILALIGVSTQVWMTQRYNTLALQSMTDKLGDLQRGSSWQDTPHVLVMGNIENPGWYEIDYDEKATTLKDLLVRLKIPPTKWMSTKQEGETFSGYGRVAFYLRHSAGDRILRPNEELRFSDSAFNRDWISDFKSSVLWKGPSVTRWTATDPNGIDTWTLTLQLPHEDKIIRGELSRTGLDEVWQLDDDKAHSETLTIRKDIEEEEWPDEVIEYVRQLRKMADERWADRAAEAVRRSEIEAVRRSRNKWEYDLTQTAASVQWFPRDDHIEMDFHQLTQSGPKFNINGKEYRAPKVTVPVDSALVFRRVEDATQPGG